MKYQFSQIVLKIQKNHWLSLKLCSEFSSDHVNVVMQEKTMCNCGAQQVYNKTLGLYRAGR